MDDKELLTELAKLFDITENGIEWLFIEGVPVSEAIPSNPAKAQAIELAFIEHFGQDEQKEWAKLIKTRNK
jgi:hypothetical protein